MNKRKEERNKKTAGKGRNGGCKEINLLLINCIASIDHCTISNKMDDHLRYYLPSRNTITYENR